MKPLFSEDANHARILAAITFHFDVSRLRFLADVLRSLSIFPVPVMDIVIVTNTFIPEELARIECLLGEILPPKTCSIRNYQNLSHPFDLTWCHKDIIAREFMELDKNGERHYSYFIYLEDDIQINFINFCYFVEFRKILRDFGVLPSFLRVEYSANLDGFVNTDNISAVDIRNLPKINLAETILVNMPNPYNACFILDADLATEYIQSRSFDPEASAAVVEWGVRERAAMGLCFENVPNPFQCRYVVPIAKDTGMAPSFAWISHLPHNYADDPNTTFGKIRMNSLFGGTSKLRQDAQNMPPSDPQNHAPPVREDLLRKLWHGQDPYIGFPKKLIGIDIQGWNSDHPFLTETIARERPKIIVEVGVWKGASAIIMANQVKTCGIDGVVIAIDTWLGSSEHWLNYAWFEDLSVKFGYPQIYYKFLANVLDSEVESVIIPLPTDSLTAYQILVAKDVNIDMIHIDASHDYEAVLLDLQLWWSRLRTGGILVGDDYYPEGHWPGVKRAVDFFMSNTPHKDFEIREGKFRVTKL